MGQYSKSVLWGSILGSIVGQHSRSVAVATRGFLGWGEHRALGLVRGLPTLAAPIFGGSHFWTLTSRGSDFYFFLLRVDWGVFPARG